MIDKTPQKLHESPHFYDYLKHLATLSTGSLLLVIAVAEKIAKNPKWEMLFSVSIICFLLSILVSLICMFFVLSSERYEAGAAPEWETDAIIITFLLTALFLGSGVICLALFAIKNFNT